MYEIFLHTKSDMTSQFLRLRKQCSFFFESLLFLMNRDVANKNNTNISLLKSITHTQLSVREKLTWAYMKHHSLSITMSSSNEAFCQMMQIVMKEYNVQTIHWDKRSLHWYEQCKFLIEFTNKYCIIYIDDYVLLQNDRYALVKQLFTHDFFFDNFRRVFVWIRYLKETFYKNEVLHLNILHSTSSEEIVSLSFITSKKIYIVSIHEFRNERTCEKNNEMNLLYCIWMINFL
jgi:hypothetical protein